MFDEIFDFIYRTFRLLIGFGKIYNKITPIDKTIERYSELHSKETKDREENYMELTNSYYDVSTIFYEWGWGSSFHFCCQKKWEDFKSATLRHEAFLADRLRVKPGEKVLDVGCGIGGPMRNIASVTGAYITGLNNNSYQIERGTEENKAAGLSHLCKFHKDDFCKMTLPNDSFDHVYAIEATCHAPRRQDVYGEIFRVLKPGKCFAAFEWCLTDNFDASNEQHQKIKKQIETGDGLPDIARFHEVQAALKEVGFEILDARDVMTDTAPDTLPWYNTLQASLIPPKKLQLTIIGKIAAFLFLRSLELVGFAPKGTHKVSTMLETGAAGLVAGGEKKLFTPGYFLLAQKPLGAKASQGKKK